MFQCSAMQWVRKRGEFGQLSLPWKRLALRPEGWGSLMGSLKMTIYLGRCVIPVDQGLGSNFLGEYSEGSRENFSPPMPSPCQSLSRFFVVRPNPMHRSPSVRGNAPLTVSMPYGPQTGGYAMA